MRLHLRRCAYWRRCRSSGRPTARTGQGAQGQEEGESPQNRSCARPQGEARSQSCPYHNHNLHAAACRDCAGHADANPLCTASPDGRRRQQRRWRAYRHWWWLWRQFRRRLLRRLLWKWRRRRFGQRQQHHQYLSNLFGQFVLGQHIFG